MRGVSNKHCLLTFFILSIFEWPLKMVFTVCSIDSLRLILNGDRSALSRKLFTPFATSPGLPLVFVRKHLRSVCGVCVTRVLIFSLSEKKYLQILPPQRSYLGFETFVVIKTLQVIIRPNKKINVFQVTGLKFLGRVGTHIFFK